MLGKHMNAMKRLFQTAEVIDGLSARDEEERKRLRP